MTGPLSVVTIVAALVLAGWFLLRAALNRAPRRAELGAALGLGVLVLAYCVAGIVLLFGDARPSEVGTFAGYLFTAGAFMPTAFQLARMEPTRWGNLILGVGAVIVPVLVLRLQQIAAVTGG